MDYDLVDSLFDDSGSGNGDEPLALPVSVRIGAGALEKAHTICDMVADINKEPIEWYGLMLAASAQPDVVIDLVFGRQESGAAHTEMNGAQIGQLANDVLAAADPRTIVGWIHSHASFGTFFSGTDHANMKTVLNSVYLNTQRSYMRRLSLIEGRREIVRDDEAMELRLRGSLETDPEFTLDLSDPGLAALDTATLEKLLSLRVRQSVLAGWSYSLVVNQGRDRAAHISYKQELPLERKVELWDRAAPVEVVEGPDFELALDRDALYAEVKQKIWQPRIITYATTLGRRRRKRRDFAVPGFDWSAYENDADDENDDDAAAAAPCGKAIGDPGPGLEGAITEEDASTFAAEILSFYTSMPLTAQAYDLDEMLYRAIARGSLLTTAGGSDQHQSLHDRLVAAADLRPEQSVARLTLDPLAVAAIVAYAQDHPGFARLVRNFRGTYVAKREALREHDSDS